MKKIRKKETSIGVIGKILNAFSSSKQDTYSCDYINKIPLKILPEDTNIDNIKESGRFAIFNAKGTLPLDFNVDDNNIFIVQYMWDAPYGRQFLYDVRTSQSFHRSLLGGIWQKWVQDVKYSAVEETFTGKYWIDGKKIYRKVVILGLLGDTIETNIFTLNGDYDSVLPSTQFYLNEEATGSIVTIPANLGTDVNITVSATSNKEGVIEITSTRGQRGVWANWNLCCVLEYTKTTD